MIIDTWSGRMSVDVDIDDVLSALVDHFRDFPTEDLYFNRDGRPYILRVVENREPYQPDVILEALNSIIKLAAELLPTDAARMSRIIGICEALRSNWKLEQFIKEGEE